MEKEERRRLAIEDIRRDMAELETLAQIEALVTREWPKEAYRRSEVVIGSRMSDRKMES